MIERALRIGIDRYLRPILVWYPLLLAGFKLELGGEEEEAAAALAREEVVAPGRQQDTTRCPAIWMGGAQGRCRSQGGLEEDDEGQKENRKKKTYMGDSQKKKPTWVKAGQFGIVGLGWAGLG